MPLLHLLQRTTGTEAVATTETAAISMLPQQKPHHPAMVAAASALAWRGAAD
jgi:hypothetical protein